MLLTSKVGYGASISEQESGRYHSPEIWRQITQRLKAITAPY